MNKYTALKIIAYALCMTIAIGSAAHAYQVNGVVDYTYTHHVIKVGSTKSSQSTLLENYQASLITPIFDPRFLRIRAGVGFRRSHSNQYADSDSLTYNVGATFFPFSIISLETYLDKTVTTVDSTSSLAGYDVDTQNYGGSLALRLRRLPGLVRGRNNRNNYNNNNSNGNNNYGNNSLGRRLIAIPLPEFFLSYGHSNSTSESSIHPLDEVRDRYSGTMRYRFNPSLDLNVDTKKELYENRLTQATYETVNTSADSTLHLRGGGYVKLTGRLTDQQTYGIFGVGIRNEVQTQDYAADARLNTSQRLAQEYRYGFRTVSSNNGSKYALHTGIAQVIYRVLPEVDARGGLQYTLEEQTIAATGALPDIHSNVQRAGMFAGVAYRDTYQPAFLDPFRFYTHYDFSSGVSDVSTNAAIDSGGSGYYYGNAAGFGLESIGWKQDSLNMSYAYSNNRDHSPAAANRWSHNLSLAASTNRVPKTHINASAGYTLSNAQSGLSNYFDSLASGSEVDSRSYYIAADISNTAVQYVTLDGGVRRGKSSTNTDYTLSSIKIDYNSLETSTYAGASFSYPVSRTLLTRLSVREQLLRREQPGTYSKEIRTFLAALDYRFRKLLCSLSYTIREDIPKPGLKTQEQLFYAKVARPF